MGLSTADYDNWVFRKKVDLAVTALMARARPSAAMTMMVIAPAVLLIAWLWPVASLVSHGTWVCYRPRVYLSYVSDGFKNWVTSNPSNLLWNYLGD
jgi:hypothetical protein